MTGVRPKVLAVDDRRENLVALQAILEGLAVEVVTVGGGEDALKKLLVDDFAVILLDAHMCAVPRGTRPICAVRTPSPLWWNSAPSCSGAPSSV